MYNPSCSFSSLAILLCDFPAFLVPGHGEDSMWKNESENELDKYGF